MRAVLLITLVAIASARAEPLNLVLPTENDALLRGDGPAFYQYIERDYHGEGLNQARAHVHLELNLMLSRQFEAWHDASFKNDPNHHGLYNGLNLVGIDIARLFLALQKRPALTIPEFLAEEETVYRVLLPASRNFDLPKFYPWMLRDKEAGDQASSEVSINRAGGPLKSQA